MTNTSDALTGVVVTVRYFAAACAAAGTDSAALTLPAGATVADLTAELAAGNPRLAAVLPRCSYLCDGVAVRDRSTVLHHGETVDVLPPFAGG
ncbi:MoaD/ThiS family protein [Mycobacterium sp. M1]|uniref:Molybdopterin synthase sulfur carrier subunit n=1 Tax=Mycolicibacter acidiphilus TaxID=2835306 RepID=A0ABS5RDH7_9MYCO|nr:MoaD/ThiS family protein [Mycolicibacter acidiphilus]MBS9532337.1 MoaD/ThiS family protein [Mycolicibacter acidiphilus]